MTSIIATVDILKDIEENSKSSQYIEILSRASKNLLNQINGILDFSKIESGKLELEEVPMRLLDSIQNVCSIMKIRCQEKELSFIEDSKITKDLVVKGDPGRIEQVFINLIGNSIKFTLRGSIAFIVEKIKETKSSVDVSFIVKDTGIGIAKRNLSKVFESFSQAENDTARHFGGTGLGLSICKKIINMMGGEIQLDSELGKGTSFSFCLSFEKSNEYIKEEENLQITKQEEVSLKGMRVLLVEDNEDNRFLFQTFLKNTGIELDTAENGEIALERVFHRGEYDLIFMDIQMPIMDGLTAMKKIRNWEISQICSSVTIIALTASVAKKDVDKSYDAGCNEYLSKPIRKKLLIETVYRYAYKRQERLARIKDRLGISQKNSDIYKKSK